MAVDASRLTLVTSKLVNAMQREVAEVLNELDDEGKDPWEYRYGILTAHLMAIADLVGASPAFRDREAMRDFLGEGGAEMIRFISEKKAEALQEREAANDD